MNGRKIKVDFKVPSGWTDLSDDKLRYVYRLISQDIPIDEIKVMCLIHWNGCKVVHRYGNRGYVLEFDGNRFCITPLQVAELAQSLNWLSDMPTYPIRLSNIGRSKPFPADFDEVPFESYIIIENLYQGYLHTRNEELLDELAGILYNNPDIKLNSEERISIFYWIESLKEYLASQYNDFFQPIKSDDGNLLGVSKNVGKQLLDAMNTQIRALTKGDITKEREVLAMNTHRALTELNSQAKEYKELNAKLNAKK